MRNYPYHTSRIICSFINAQIEHIEEKKQRKLCWFNITFVYFFTLCIFDPFFIQGDQGSVPVSLFPHFISQTSCEVVYAQKKSLAQ